MTSISEAQSRKLLRLLCERYGFCLTPLWVARLERNPPKTIDKYLETVIRAEGLDPIRVEGGLYRSMRDHVREAFERSDDAGT